MREIEALHALARRLGVHTSYTDGLGNRVEPGPETLRRVCAALGASSEALSGAEEAPPTGSTREGQGGLPPTVAAWDGRLDDLRLSQDTASALAESPDAVELVLEDGSSVPVIVDGDTLRIHRRLPLGYHELRLMGGRGHRGRCTVISAPTRAFRRPGARRCWGLGTHLAALRSARSRSLGDLRDLESTCDWVAGLGGDVVTVLPLLPTFNDARDPEPSPYSPVSRLFWSELVLDLGERHRPVPGGNTLDVTRADAEVRAALAGLPGPATDRLDSELVRYARFRGAQKRLGRDWRRWPDEARDGRLKDEDVDAVEERFHLVAQLQARDQLAGLKARLDGKGMRLGLDLAVGAHPDGYDTWSRQALFAEGMTVGAPPDPGFPGGQDWGFAPVLPGASRREGHRYLAASIAHQASLSRVLRVDHVMAFTRLYWIPQGMGRHEGTYVDYPVDELFAVLTLEAERHRCEVVGENLGTVPQDIDEALRRHEIRGMYLAMFQAASVNPTAPGEGDVALIGSHDTPTFAGWVAGRDIRERVRCGLLAPDDEAAEQEERAAAAAGLAEMLGGSLDDLPDLLVRLLEWLGGSDSSLVLPWIEDLWLEEEQVNLPGTRSSARPNWQRPMAQPLETVFADPEVRGRLQRLAATRASDEATVPVRDDGLAPAGT